MSGTPAQTRDRRRSDRRGRDRRRRAEEGFASFLEREIFRARTILAFAVLLMLAVGTRWGLHVLREDAPAGWPQYHPPTASPHYGETHTAERFADAGLPASERYGALYDYLFEGTLRNTVGAGARVLFPGYPGTLGAQEDGFRGFARSAPLIAGMIASGRDGSGRGAEWLTHGLVTGTDPGQQGYWGSIAPRHLVADDAADIARALWLTRDIVWPRLNAAEKTRIAAWLAPLITLPSLGPRELLPAVVVERVLAALGMPADPAASRSRLHDAQHMLTEQGWLLPDGARADLSNAWRESYDMFWIGRIDPAIAAGFVPSAVAASADLTLHLISPRGVPMFGDDICARTALPVPVLAAYALGVGSVTAGDARAASDAVWGYFLPRGALRDGGLAQGYFGPDPRLTPNDAGPGTCQWGLRGLVITLMLSQEDGFWRARPATLPVQSGNYRLPLKTLGWLLQGQQARQSISLDITANPEGDMPLEDYGRWDRAMTRLRHLPARPDNARARWGRAVYASDAPLVADPLAQEAAPPAAP